MQNIPEEYLLLFNTLTDAEAALAHLQATLIAAQRQAEELYIGGGVLAKPSAKTQ